MSSHESIRNLLSLAAAGALSPQELLEVQAHARTCESCRRELEAWSVFAVGLKGMPQPVVPADLIARTQARILREREAAAERRWNILTLLSLSIFAWVASVAFWLLIRELSGGVLNVLGTNMLNAGPWFFVTSTVALITAAATAVLVGNRSQIGRML